MKDHMNSSVLLERSLLNPGSGLKTMVLMLKYKKLACHFRKKQTEKDNDFAKSCDIESDLFDQAPRYSSAPPQPNSGYLAIQSELLEESLYLEDTVSPLSDIEFDSYYLFPSEVKQKPTPALYEMDEPLRIQSPIPSRPLQIIPFDEAWLKILAPYISSQSCLQVSPPSVIPSTPIVNFGGRSVEIIDYILHQEPPSCYDSSPCDSSNFTIG
jgi:hypothetical protein